MNGQWISTRDYATSPKMFAIGWVILAATAALTVGQAGVALAVAPAAARVPPVTTDTGEVGKILRFWYGRGSAAGNSGDYYDNRDRGHSMLRMSKFPQLQIIQYTDQERQRRRDWGLQVRTLSRDVTFGNSSTASRPTAFGSNSRQAMYSRAAAILLYRQYLSNHLYIYPEHRDHDPGRNGRGGYGDLFPANFPYLITSQGSSGSDQRFMEAVAFTLAAFKPETKKRLISTGLLMPTVQMILRSCMRGADGRGDYLTGRAHPSVFNGKDIDAMAIVRMAHAMDPNEIPPMIQLNVVEDIHSESGRDWFDPGKTEILFDTPCAIARIGRSVKKVRRMVVTAEASSDSSGRPLTYHWSLLRGDPNEVQIKPLNEKGSLVELRIAFTPSRPVWPGADIQSPRVDIGAFVNNGRYYSAPGFVTMYFLPNEARTYDKSGSIAEVDYSFGDSTIGYPTSDPRAASYDIADWKPLLDALTDDGDDLPARLLRRHLTKNKLNELAIAAREFERALAREAGPRNTREKAFAARDAAKQGRDQAIKDLAAAKKAGDKDKITGADKALKERLAAYKLAYDDATKAERAWRASMKAGAAVLTRPRPRLGGIPLAGRRRAGSIPAGRTAMDCIEQALNAIKNAPTLYTANAARITAMLKAAPPADTRAVTAARDKLVAGGVLAGDDSIGWRLTPLLDGDGPPEKRLSVSQRNRLEWFNIELMSRLLYPGAIGLKFSRNYVHKMLTSPDKTWRDVYHYDKSGKLAGWTRYDGDKTTNFTPEGKPAR